MKQQADGLKKQVDRCTAVRFQLTPSWRFRPTEIARALDELNHHLPKKKRVTQKWLLAQQRDGQRVEDAAAI